MIITPYEMPDRLHDGQERRRSVALRAFQALVAPAGVIVIGANRAYCDDSRPTVRTRDEDMRHET